MCSSPKKPILKPLPKVAGQFVINGYTGVGMFVEIQRLGEIFETPFVERVHSRIDVMLKILVLVANRGDVGQ